MTDCLVPLEATLRQDVGPGAGDCSEASAQLCGWVFSRFSQTSVHFLHSQRAVVTGTCWRLPVAILPVVTLWTRTVV